jgi:hypothetical protein
MKHYKHKYDLKTVTCKICGQEKNSLRQHISRSHKEWTWEKYCDEFNYDPKMGRIMPEETKKLLSENKKRFYRETARGKELRDRQSIEWSKNNPATWEHNKVKLSAAAIKRLQNDDDNFGNGHSCRGMKCITDTFTTRSFNEYKVIMTLKENNIEFEYEPHTIKYSVGDKVRTYLPDLLINGEYYELKADLYNLDYTKYNNVINSNKDIVLHVVTPKMLVDLLNIKIIDKFKLYAIMKNDLDNDRLKIVYATKEYKHSILDDIHPNNRNHKNITLSIKKEKGKL